SSAAAAASYYTDFDSLDVSPSFNIAAWEDQAYFVHECTHAHIDIQELGKHSGHENEAVAYLAEAMFLVASGKAPLGTQPTRIVSQQIATLLLANKRYAVLPSEATALVAEVAKEPIYKTKIEYVSDGFKRSFVEVLFR
ncbi:MAG TPA: hypothetical protein VEQ63_13890, partial [Bryobacteraceae bacterium]|nr:hypothetical protein [Bryobacteraceae bacterium]